jgi:hypothetical protein
MWNEILGNVFRRTVDGFAERVAAFGPNLLAALMLLLGGSLVAVLLRFVLRPVLRWLGLDRFADRVGVTQLTRRAGMRSPFSSALATGVAWTVFGAFLLLAIGALNLQVATDLVSRAFTYLPQLLIATGIMMLGLMVAGFIRRSVLIAAVNARLRSARLLAASAQSAITILFAAMALEHVGIGRQVVLTAFSILFGGAVLALALAFGLAGREMARDALERLLRRGEGVGDDDGLRHL